VVPITMPGIRSCLGKNIALVEMKLAVAALAQSF
jgi:cytochrome P450